MNKISETARYLASYLIENHEAFLFWDQHENPYDPDKQTLHLEPLQKSIQEFYDTLK